MQSLADAQAGEYTIKWMLGNKQAIEFMNGYDIREGSSVRVIRQVMDSVIIGVHGMRLAVGKEIAERIKV